MDSEATARQVTIYKRVGGNYPFEDWLRSLKDKKARSLVVTRIERMEEGNLGKYRNLGAGLAELKIPHGPGYRVYFGQDGPVIVVLLGGGNKSTQVKDIEIARRNWNDYQERKEKQVSFD